MKLATSKITNFPDYMKNLNVLATFDRRNDIRKKGGSRLNIAHNGDFSRATGIISTLGRSDGSLTKRYNQETVIALIDHSILRLRMQTKNRHHLLRKAIFDGIRGTRWLFSAYFLEDKVSFKQAIEDLNNTEEKFKQIITEAVCNLNQFNYIYHNHIEPVRKLLCNQQDFMSDQEILNDGICYGICLKWLQRWVISNKSSFTDSKHANAFRAPKNLNTKGAEMGMLFDQQREINKGYKFDSNNKLTPTSSVSGHISGVKERHDLAKYVNDKHAAKIPYKEMGLTEEQDNALKNNWGKINFNYKLHSYNNKVKGKQLNFTEYYNRIDSKYKDLYTTGLGSFYFKDLMYFRDASDFREEMSELFLQFVSESETMKSTNKRIGFQIGFFYGKSYDHKYVFDIPNHVLDTNNGHAMAFHIDDNGNYVAFDPNFGEFICRTGHELISQFARWLSFYSFSGFINQICHMKIIHRDNL